MTQRLDCRVPAESLSFESWSRGAVGWHRACLAHHRRHMNRTASIVVVLLLVGNPGARVLCHAWCERDVPLTGAVSTHCHGAPADGKGIEATAHGCTDAIAPPGLLTASPDRVDRTAVGLPVAAAVAVSWPERRHLDGSVLARADSSPPHGTPVTILRI